MTVARVSSVHRPTNTGEKCQGTISPGTGIEGDIQALSSSCPWSNSDEGTNSDGIGWGLAHGGGAQSIVEIFNGMMVGQST